MLSKRTNILFTEEMFRRLTSLAAKQQQSVGGLVRDAVKQIYFDQADRRNQDKYQALKRIAKRRKSLVPLKEDIVKLVQYGRKFS